MWFYPLLLMFVLLGLAGVIFLGGVYTLVLVPLAVIGIISALGYVLWIRSQTGSVTGETAATSGGTESPLPHRRRRPPRRVPTTPEHLVDARRETARAPEQ